METKDIIKELRKNRGLSAQQVADGCEMSFGVYKKYESGERGVGVPALQKLADFYGVTVDYLLGRETREPETIDKLVGEFNMSKFEKEVLESYLSLPKDMRGNLMEFLQNFVQKVINRNNE